ncbi:MAG: response regulator [Candidatus Thermoplasmatota archaeon]
MTGAAKGRGRRILLVDDEPDILDTVKQLLEYRFSDVEVVVAPSGMAALKQLETAPFNLVITDFRMPGMDGAELVARVRSQWPDTPVLMVTAYLEPTTHDELARRAPGLDVLPKPLELDSFLATVGRVLGKGPVTA